MTRNPSFSERDLKMSLPETGSIVLPSPGGTTSFNLRKLVFYMFRKQQEANKQNFYNSVLGGIWKTVVEFPYTRWFWKEAEAIRDRIKEWLVLRSEKASMLFHEKDGMLHLKVFR